MFRPNQTCVVRSIAGYSVYGQPQEGKRKREKCAIVRYVIKNEKSSGRADSSATRGNAREQQADAIFLMSPNTTADIDSVIELHSHDFRVVSKEPRFAISGRLDHFEVGCSYWSDNESTTTS
ncbi:hypothetical protein J888_1229 [Acinetobacter baumannii 44327_5]|nr:hypothetical protein J888_1229 [Acinetobacter baumannii 44327_5]